MAFIASNSRIQKTHWHTSAHLETFTARGGHSNLNAYSALLDYVRTKILLLSERSKSKLSFRRKKALKLYKI